jgi:hypothetical protein
MKKSSPRGSTAQKEKKSDTPKRVGGQPENDEDARAAGMKSATSNTPRKGR